MKPVFAARRRAEEFAALVEDPSSAGPDDARYAQLLELVGALGEAAAPQARPEFVADLRARLLAEAETALVPVDTSRLVLPPRRPARERRLAVAVGGLALVGATTSMAMAAQGSLPGDALYPVKRAIEDVRTGISVGDGQKGSAMLANAGDRLDEATRLAHGNQAQDGLAVADTLNDFTDQAAQASDLLLGDYEQTGNQSSVDQLRAFTARSLGELTALESVVPADARDELMHAAQVLIAIDDATQQACPACHGGGITQIPPVFTPTSASTGNPFATQQSAHHHGRHRHGSTTGGGQPALPSVGQGALPPGSVTDPVTGGGTGGGDPTTSGSATDPITSLTDGLTGGGSQPTSSPDVPGVKKTVKDVNNDVGQILDGATGAVDSTLP